MMNNRPKIVDNDKDTISVLVAGNEVMSWVYADRKDYREKMRHAHYFCGGYMCAIGAERKYPEGRNDEQA